MNFGKIKETYNKNAIVQEKMAKKLFRVIENFSHSPLKLLEIGCGTGFLTRQLVEKFEGEIFLNDINPNQTEFNNVAFLQGDICEIEIPDSVDLIASNAVFQWINNLESLFLKLRSSLAPGGILAFSTFGLQNYKQFGEFGALNYLDLSELERILTKSSFKILHLEEELMSLYFNSPNDVLNHIKTTGVSTFGGSGLWTYGMLKKFEETYIQKYSDNNGVELTYHPIYVCASCD